MAKVIGRLTKVVIGVEGTRGTLADQDFAVPVTSLDMDDVPEYLDNDSGFGNISEFNDSDLNTMHGEGGYEGKVFDHVIGAELVAVVGQLPTTTSVVGQSGVYQHDYAVANNNSHKSLSLFTKEDGSTLAYALGMVDTFSIDAALDQYLTRSLKIQSKPSTDYTPTAEPAYIRGVEFMAKNLAIKVATTQGGLDAATTKKVTAFNFEVAKNLDVQYVFGTSVPDDIQNQQIGVTGSIEARKEDSTYRDVMKGGLKRAIRFFAENSDVTIGTSAHPSLRVDFPYVAFKENPKNRDNNAITTESVNFQANYSLEEAALFTARLINTTATYA